MTWDPQNFSKKDGEHRKPGSAPYKKISPYYENKAAGEKTETPSIVTPSVGATEKELLACIRANRTEGPVYIPGARESTMFVVPLDPNFCKHPPESGKKLAGLVHKLLEGKLVAGCSAIFDGSRSVQALNINVEGHLVKKEVLTTMEAIQTTLGTFRNDIAR